MVGTRQGQDGNDGAHEQRTKTQTDTELVQRRPATAQLDHRPPTGIAHQQPVPDHGDGSAHNSHDQSGVRSEEHHSAMVIEPRGTGDQYQEHGGRLSTEEEQNAHHELDPAEPLRLPRRDTPLGADRNESVQDASGPGSRHRRPGGNGGAHGPMFPPPGVMRLLLEDQIASSWRTR